MIDLSQFYGSMDRHKLHHNFFLTDGVNYLAKEGGAYWLMDLIWSYQPSLADEHFQIWELKISDNQAVVTMRQDSDMDPLVTQEIPYTDFEQNTGLKEIKLFACREDNYCIVLLPSEY